MVVRASLSSGSARIAVSVFAFLFGATFTSAASAAATITFRYQYETFPISTVDLPQSLSQEVWMLHGIPIAPPQGVRVDGDTIPPLPTGLVRQTIPTLDRTKVASVLTKKIATFLDRPAGEVKIWRDEEGRVQFDGVGYDGRALDVERTIDLTEAALTLGASEVILPLRLTPPTVTVDDPVLREKGIRELVTIGESDFSRSPVNRIHNIKTGLKKLSGTLVERGGVFTFGQFLGPVNGAAGFLKELVIKGDRTEPDYGGGLCQVSTTAYRGAWTFGLPILRRKNHSYAVSHYFPHGTDATVYPPAVDLSFKNDTPAALLLQTATEGTNAYFFYYGTKDTRETLLFGPYIWGRTSPPPDRTEQTTEIPPGTTKKLGERVAGLQAAWFRIVTTSTGETVTPTYSLYQARPLYTLVGVEALPSSEQSSATGGSLD